MIAESTTSGFPYLPSSCEKVHKYTFDFLPDLLSCEKTSLGVSVRILQSWAKAYTSVNTDLHNLSSTDKSTYKMNQDVR